ncbi:MAG: HNH endonuclease signature motif containing protein, partial [Promethearchaeota archaeon]
MNNKKTRYKSKRIEFTPSAKRKIVRDCRNLCAFPDCNKKVVSTKITIKDEQDGWFQGHVAHIYPASAKGKGGFRYDENIPESFIKSPKNGILLCVPHHDEIDDILNKEKYTAEALLRMRENHIIRVKDIPNNLKKINQIDFEPIDTSPEYNDKRIALLETSIRNLIIKYYSENFPPSRNIMISKLLNIINMFRSGYLDMFVKNNLIQHQKLINYHFPEFGKNLFPQIFKQKIKDKEILIKN